MRFLRFFRESSSSPLQPYYQHFELHSKILEDIRWSRCTTDINDTNAHIFPRDLNYSR
jgi:hypothetical protein